MRFCFDEAVRVLEAIVEALNGDRGKDYTPQISRHRIRRTECPEFTKTMVRVKKHLRPPVRADPKKRSGAGRKNQSQITGRQFISKTGGKYMGFFTTAVSTMSTLVVALGGGVGVWGVINLMEGYGSDNPASKSQGVKQLMAGGGIMLLGLKVVPMLSTLITI